MRLINLDELMKYPIRLNHFDKENGDINFVYGIESVLEYAEYLPIIDAVPVTRCKNCAKASHDSIFGKYFCQGKEVRPDHFCGDGERKEE